MAASVVRMGKKLGLVGIPRMRAAAAAAANIRSDLCQKNRHLATNAEGLSEGGKTQGLSNGKKHTADKTKLYRGIVSLTLAAVGWAYISYKERGLEVREAEAYRKFEDAFGKSIEEQFVKGGLKRD